MWNSKLHLVIALSTWTERLNLKNGEKRKMPLS